MRLAYPILAVMLDGKEHTESEIVSRVKHFIKPEQAVRRYCHMVNQNRAYKRGKNQSGKVILSTRKEDLTPDLTGVADSVAWVVHEGILSLCHKNKGRGRPNARLIPYLEKMETGAWKLNPEAREYIKVAPIVASCIGKAITVNLKARGELP